MKASSKRVAIGLLALVGAISLLKVSAQEPDEPRSTKPAVSTEWDGLSESERSLRGGRRMPRQILDQDVYRSNALQADFIVQWMYIDPPGRHFEFWGARIVGMAPSSPLWQISVGPGDVITRLDGIPIARRMRRRNGGWDVPELERHYGRTEVRHIHQGSQVVHDGWINVNIYSDDTSLPALSP